MPQELSVDPLLTPLPSSISPDPGESVGTIISSSVLGTLCSFASHGIIHCDVRKGNILFFLKPPPPVVVDIGQSALREDDSESVVTTDVKVHHTTRSRDQISRYVPPTFFPDPRGADCCNAVVNMKGQRWCVATEETGPGGIRLDEGTKSLLGLLQRRLAC